MVMQISRTRIPNNPPTNLAEGQLSVEMAGDQPKLWVGVPTSIDLSGRRLLGGGFVTGDTKLTFKQAADPGWVMMNDGTIGDALSNATARADDDCEALFKLLWPIESGQIGNGAPTGTANGDWAGHRTLTLPRHLGRALAIAGQGVGLSNRVLGAWDGAETITQTLAQMPSHNHSVPSWGGGHTQGQANALGSFPGNFDLPTSLTGGGGAMNIMNPRAYLNIMIKL